MRRILVLVVAVLSCLTIWYLWIKKYDYQISFKVKGTPESIYYQILEWETWSEDSKVNTISVIDTMLFNKVVQRASLQDTILDVEWSLLGVNDSITDITVGIKSKKDAVINRIGILVGETNFSRSLKKEFRGFRKKSNDFAKTFKVIIDGVSEMPALEYLYVSEQSIRSEKANMMIRANVDLYPKIKENQITQKGPPFVKITRWNILNDSIKFVFGFPVKYNDSLPVNDIIKYQKTPSKKAIKATYYGNYRNSDQAWFSLIEYAKKHDINIEEEPLEIFYNNPLSGGNELDWKAEIFMPIKEE